MRLLEIHGGPFESSIDSAIHAFVHNRIRRIGPAWKKQKEYQHQTLRDFLASVFFEKFLEDNHKAQNMKPHHLKRLIKNVMRGYFESNNTFTFTGGITLDGVGPPFE